MSGTHREPADPAAPAPEGRGGPGGSVEPHLVDAHVHIESSKLMVDEFARVVLARGTTTIRSGFTSPPSGRPFAR